MKSKLFAVLIFFVAGGVFLPAQAGGPVETSVFAVQAVAVDVKAADAASAKNQALIDVQMKAIVILAERLGNAELASEIGKLPPKEVLPLLKSLSIEEESAAPGRYIGKFTVRFLPRKIEKLFGNYGINIISEQANPFLVVPVWKTATGLELWEDNPWRQAWLNQHLEQALVPIIIPLGDMEDTEAVKAEDVANQDPVKLEALRRRYGVKYLVIAVAEAAEGEALHVTMSGNSSVGKINIDKRYEGEPPSVSAAAKAAVERIHAIMLEKYKTDQQKIAAAKAYDAKPASSSIPVSVPFSGPTEWTKLRSQILASPGVIGVDVASLAPNGAVIRLMYTGDLSTVQGAIRSAGLQLEQMEEGATWIIRPL